MGEEREESNHGYSLEEAFDVLKKTIQEVRDGYRSRLTILSIATHKPECTFAGKTMPQEVALAAMEKLKEELGARISEGDDSGCEEKIDPDHLLGIPFMIPTGQTNIFLVRRKVYRIFLEGKTVKGEEWSIENTQPMNLGRQICYKGWKITQRALGTIDWT